MPEVLGLKEPADDLPDFSAYLDRAGWPAAWSMRNGPVAASDRARLSEQQMKLYLSGVISRASRHENLQKGEIVRADRAVGIMGRIEEGPSVACAHLCKTVETNAWTR